MVQCIGDGDLMYANTLMCVKAPPIPSNQIQPTKSYHYPEPKSPLCRAELVDEGEGSELR